MPQYVSLPADVAEKYELVGWVGGDTQVFGKHGTISVKNMTLRQAERLVAGGFKKLRAKAAPDAAPASAPSAKAK